MATSEEFLGPSCLICEREGEIVEPDSIARPSTLTRLFFFSILPLPDPSTMLRHSHGYNLSLNVYVSKAAGPGCHVPPFDLPSTPVHITH